jgi:hypothetical protein
MRSRCQGILAEIGTDALLGLLLLLLLPTGRLLLLFLLRVFLWAVAEEALRVVLFVAGK